MICAFFFGEIILYINYIILLGNFVNEKCIKKKKIEKPFRKKKNGKSRIWDKKERKKKSTYWGVWQFCKIL